MSEMKQGEAVQEYLSMIRKAWLGRLEIPTEWLGGPNTDNFQSYYTFPPVLDLLESLREDQIKPIHVEDQTVRMLDINDPLPDFVEPQQIFEDENSEIFDMNTIRTFGRFVKIMTFALGESAGFGWSMTLRMAMHITGFFTGFSGTINRESAVGESLQEPSETALPIRFAVMIYRYGSRPHPSMLFNSNHNHMSPSLMDRSLNYANFMRITPTHPALLIGIIDEKEIFTAMNKKQFLDSLNLSVKPSLQYIIDGWRQYCLQNGSSIDERFPPWLIVFSLVVDREQVTIIAHYPASPHLRAFTVSPEIASVVLDSIPSHLSVRMSPGNIWQDPPPDNIWIYNRLRLCMALSRIMKNSRRILLMWDELRWSSETLLEEEEYDRKMAKWKWRTPNPSETAEDVWAESLSEEAREDYEIEKEAIHAVYFAEEEDEEDGEKENATWLAPTGSDNDDTKVREDAVHESNEKILLWFERFPEDAQFDPLPVQD